MSSARELLPVDILLVDDRPSNLMSLQALLQDPAYNLVLARSGEEALAQLLRREFALVLLDVAMPGMDGFQVAALMKEREQSKHIPIIFVTATIYEVEQVARGYTVGAVDFLRKPLDPHAVRNKVAVFVELFRQRKEIDRQVAQLRAHELREENTCRERVKATLQDSESAFQLTFEKAPIGIGHTNADGRFIRANPRLCEMLGYLEDELLGRRLEDLAVGADAAAPVAQLPRLQTGHSVYVGEHALRRSTGDTVWVQASVAALPAPAPVHTRATVRDEVTRFVVVAMDITAQKNAEHERGRLVGQLQQGIRTRDDFLRIVAHELKDPVTPLRLHAETLQTEMRRGAPIAADKLVACLDAIERTAARLDELVERLLDLTRVDAVRLAVEEVDLGAVVDAVVRRLGRDAEQARSTLEVAIVPAIVGRWDRLRMEQVVANLIANAIKFGAGKPIEVSITQANGVARLQVRDHGMGIPREDHERIFERFERVAPPGHDSGFGLGLWIVRRIVQAHGGDVSVWSEVGKGSVFTVEVPLHLELDAIPEDGPPHRGHEARP